MSSDIPGARAELVRLKVALQKPMDRKDVIAGIDRALQKMHRKSSPRRHTGRHTPMSRALAIEIQEYAAEHPEMTQTEMAAHFDINAGRVSEALNGDWD